MCVLSIHCGTYECVIFLSHPRSIAEFCNITPVTVPRKPCWPVTDGFHPCLLTSNCHCTLYKVLSFVNRDSLRYSFDPEIFNCRSDKITIKLSPVCLVIVIVVIVNMVVVVVVIVVSVVLVAIVVVLVVVVVVLVVVVVVVVIV